MNTLLALASILTAAAGLLIAYVLRKPYVRAAKMFRQGKVDRKTLKLKNAGTATAICIVLQDHYGHAIDVGGHVKVKKCGRPSTAVSGVSVWSGVASG